MSACLLFAVFIVLLLISNHESAEPEQTQINIPVTIRVEQPIPAEPTDREIVSSTEPEFLPDPVIENPGAATWKHVEVKSGDNLSAIFAQVGLSDRELFHVLNSNDEAKILNRVFPGYQLSFSIPKPGQLEQLKVLKSPLEGFLFTLIDGFYDVEKISRAPEIRQVFKHGSITDSLFMAGLKENIPDLTIMEMANIFGGVIDFILDPRLGDDFSILFEEKYLDDEFIGTGEILAAQFTNQGKQFVAVQYENALGEIGYYNPLGESMRKAFLRAPIDVFRISSNFSLARRHPILNTIRAHKGTDYAAPKGTPIRATSDGTVTWAGRNGSFGKLIVIKHRGAFETKYAHLSDYANGAKKGRRVRQGDIIGYVGSTGSATGPHLHYEFLMNGVHKNPRTILDKLPKAESIPADELNRFRHQSEPLLVQFKALEKTKMLALGQHGAE
ncbi:MAG: peptidoglycan DD-metalloendopeptidase family protein [Gammaproteobacteria bacterium]|nr:peptidoglycan DD-metalloendopeptidase family protein [Gammaproteobacteria bacterium]